MTVFANMGGQEEVRFDAIAQSWAHVVVPLNTLAVECVAAPVVAYPVLAGVTALPARLPRV